MAKFNNSDPNEWEWNKLLDSLIDIRRENDVPSHVKTSEYEAQHNSEIG